MNDRTYRCAHCAAIISIPDHLRRVTLADVQAVHDATCPGLLRVKR